MYILLSLECRRQTRKKCSNSITQNISIRNHPLVWRLTYQSTNEETSTAIHYTYYKLLYLDTTYWNNRRHNDLKINFPTIRMNLPSVLIMVHLESIKEICHNQLIFIYIFKIITFFSLSLKLLKAPNQFSPLFKYFLLKNKIKQTKIYIWVNSMVMLKVILFFVYIVNEVSI